MNNVWDPELEWKLRHVRTPEGARYYGKPIGSPITAADRATARRRSAGGSTGGERASGSETTGSGSSGAREGARKPRAAAAPTPSPTRTREGATTPAAKKTTTAPIREGAKTPRKRTSARVPGLAAADGPQNRERRSTPVPPDTATARPQLYTYQRKNIIKLGLDTETNDTVREAALRVEERRPITQEQSEALASALRERAKADGVKPVQKRSLLRSADTFDAAAHRARGESFTPADVAGTKPSKTSVADVGDGDTIIIPDGSGGTVIGKVVNNEPIMGGKLHKVAVVKDDGTLSFHLIDPKAISYLLPDRPDPEPVDSPQGGGDEVPDVVAARVLREERLRNREVELHSATAYISLYETAVRERLAYVAQDSTSANYRKSMEAQRAEAIEAIHKAVDGQREKTLAVTATRQLSQQFPGRESTFEESALLDDTFGGALRGVREAVAENLIASLTNAQPGPDDNEQFFLHHHARAMTGTGGVKTLSNQQRVGIADSLDRIQTRVQDSDGGTVDAPTTPDVVTGSLKERVASYRSALPKDINEVGKARVRGAKYGVISLTDLESGNLPEPSVAEFSRKDRASDGGPGETAMGHLDIVNAVGREIDETVQERIKARFVKDGLSGDYEKDLKNLSDAADAARKKFQKYNSELTEATGKARRDFNESLSEEETAIYNSVGMLNRMTGSTVNIEDPQARAILERLKVARAEVKERFAGQEGLGAEADAAQARVVGIRDKYSELRRDETIRALREIRDFGGADLKFKNPGKGVPETHLESLRYAQNFYPKEWLNLINERTAKNHPDGLIVVATGRGYYSDRRGEMALSEMRFASDTDINERPADRVAIHEMGHAAEAAIPALVNMEEAYLWMRTSAGPIGERVRTGRKQMVDGQETFEDQFPERYTGKTYILNELTKNTFGVNDAYEVFTTQVESLFAGADYGDEGLRRWTIGTLALL